jgi:pimeloyl-ACP methyl ester carboxylesterase
VLVVDRRGVGSSAAGGTAADYPRDIVACAGWLHDHGQARLAVLGSSAGAPVALVAAAPTGFADAAPPPPSGAAAFPGVPCAVVLVSPARRSAPAVARSCWPTSGASAPRCVYEEGTATFADAAESLSRTSRPTPRADHAHAHATYRFGRPNGAGTVPISSMSAGRSTAAQWVD